MEFRYTIEPENPADVNVTVLGPQTGLGKGDIIADQLDNTSDTAQKVLFVVTPYTIDANGVEHCTGP